MASLFSKPNTPKLPQQPPLVLADEMTLKRARRRKNIEIANRSGRLSTILTQPGPLGGVTYG